MPRRRQNYYQRWLKNHVTITLRLSREEVEGIKKYKSEINLSYHDMLLDYFPLLSALKEFLKVLEVRGYLYDKADVNNVRFMSEQYYQQLPERIRQFFEEKQFTIKEGFTTRSVKGYVLKKE
jgi:6-pyruvoyl-tetrahydropterin synthase